MTDRHSKSVGRSLTDTLRSTLDGLIFKLEKRTTRLRSPIVVGLFCALMAVILACPDYARFRPYDGVPWAARAIDWKFAHPLDRIPVEQFAVDALPGQSGIVEHLQKRSFRVAVPWICHVLGFSVTAALIGQQVIAISFLSLIYASLRKTLIDPLSALMGTIAFSSSFVGQWGFSDVVYFDCVAWFLMGLSTWQHRWWTVCVTTAISGLVDERAILAVPLLWLLRCMEGPAFPSLRCLLSKRANLGYATGVLLFGIARLLLGMRIHEGICTSGVGVGPLVYNGMVLPLALLLLLEGWSPVVLLSMMHLSARHGLRALVCLFVAAAPVTFAALLVYDLSRSLGYLFPLVLVTSKVLAQTPITSVRRILAAAGLISIILPCYYFLLALHMIPPMFRLL